MCDLRRCDLEAWSAQEDIFRAVVEDDTAAVESYLQSGGNASLVDSEHMTPLHFAADRGNATIVSLLLSHGADVNAVDKEGYTPLAYAVMCENTVRCYYCIMFVIDGLGVGNCANIDETWSRYFNKICQWRDCF